jgi:hypothetical protein
MAVARQGSLAGAVLITLLAAGCGGQAATPHQVTVQGCADFGVQVIHQRRTVTREPAACRGLSQAQVEQAVSKAIRLTAGSHHKAVLRGLAVAAGARLAYLITAAPPPSAARAPAGAARPRPAAAGAARGDTAVTVAALVSWLITAGSGAYLLAGWISHGGARRPRTRSTGLPPVVIFGHFGLAVTGLLIWVAFLATDATALAWIAAGLLLPVVGLGFATLALLISGVGFPAAPAAGGRRAARADRVPVLVIAGHGSAAALTILLVVLAAVAAWTG